MTNLPKSLLKQAKDYKNLPTKERRLFIETLYNEPYYYSFQAIGDLVGYDGKRIRKHHPKMKTRDRSEAQKLSLEVGRNAHPTKGRERSEDEKVKISEGISKSWKESSPEHKEKMSIAGKKRWDKLSEASKQELRRMAGKSLRKAAVEGSKLEHYFFNKLSQARYKPSLHKKHLISNDNLEIDIMLAGKKIVIEVDGPSHFRPIWGEESFKKTQKSDSEKNGLLLTKGYVVIRVRHEKSPTQKEARDLFNELLETIKRVTENRPTSVNDSLIYIGAKV
jgi:very-short-patch-repair endonuclease